MSNRYDNDPRLTYELIVAKYFPSTGDLDTCRVITAGTHEQCIAYMDRRATKHNVRRIANSVEYTRADGVVVNYRIFHAVA